MGFTTLIRGTLRISLYEKAKKFKELCSDNMYETIENLALATGSSSERTIRDAKKILKVGFFPEGFMDEQNTTFMVSKKIYEQYLRAEEHRKLMEQEEEKAAAESKLTNTERTELDVMVGKGMEYVSRLHALNEDIPGEVISNKLTRLEGLLGEIFARVKEHPEQMRSAIKDDVR